MRGSLTDAERNHLRQQAAAIFFAAVNAVNPATLVGQHLVRDGLDAVVTSARGDSLRRWQLPVAVVGAGKAAARMAAACESILGVEQVNGIVVAPESECPPEPRSAAGIEIAPGGHPLPNAKGIDSTRRLLAMVAGTYRPVVCLLSGGASSLMVQPPSPLTLADKIEVNRLLLACGASIEELNTVRKHLSVVKGGGLLRSLNANSPGMAALVLSDVIGDDLSTVASGPTSADRSTFADAMQIFDKYELTQLMPQPVVQRLSSGARGGLPETLKPADPINVRCVNLLIGSNSTALAAAREAAAAAGFATIVVETPIAGDSTAAGVDLANRLLLLAREKKGPLCVLAGGETTVRVQGSGRGGRNQEMALAAAEPLNRSRWLLLSAGTDGIDGPTPAAGAFVDGTTAQRAASRQFLPRRYLEDNDSYSFFEALGDLFETGSTGTNVMDVKIALLPGSEG